MKAAVRVELDRLKAKSADGRLMPKSVIDAARDRKNALHGEFTWDREKAHEQNLQREAQRLIAEYTVVIMRGDTAVRTRHFISLTSDRRNGGGYRVVADVLSDEAMSQQMLADALSELASFQAKYRRLAELAGVFAAIAEVTAKRDYQKRRKAA